ncbi:MAG: ABC transporter permease [Verrucomicrobiota bacterium]
MKIALPAYTLWLREVVRFLRQRDRVIGALVTPIVFWLLLGAGLGRSFQAGEGHGYLEYFFTGTVVMILLFTAIFSTISVIEDRREGFLQGVLVAPVGRFGIVMGKLLGGATLAMLQGILFLLLAPLAGVPISLAGLPWLLVAMSLVAFALTGLGFLLAWQLNSSQGFHAIMNLLLIPMWLLSGALFPKEGAQTWMKWVMLCNPLTYGVTAIRQGLYWNQPQPHAGLALGITVVFTGVMLGLSLLVTRRTTSGDLL